MQNNTWQGCYTQTATAIWGGVSGGPCPNASLDGGINFSWGQYTLSQNISINQALSAAGVGLQITGYTYSWSVKNSNINGQQPGSYDWYTHVTVDLISPTGQILESDFYPYGYWIPQWTRFSGVRTYAGDYSLSSVSTLRLSVSGWDDGFWAGYYGPEYRDFDLRINYSLDPCASDPLYSSTCPGYAQAILALTQTETATSTPGAEIVETNVVVEATPLASTKTTLGSGVSMTAALSSIARERERISALEKSVTESSQEQSDQINAQIQEIDATIIQSSNIGDAAVVGTGTSANNSVSVGGFSAVDLLVDQTTHSQGDTSREQQTSTVRQNSPDSDLAGGISLVALAVQPPGFAAYSVVMPDSRFYEPREIYRGQNTVDNARALRALSSDRLHQDMVNQQYRR